MSQQGGARQRTVVALVHNRLLFDSRVLREARSTAQLGDRVVVCAAISGRRPPRTSERDGFETVHIGYDPLDRRVWDNRQRLARPWRFRNIFGAWLLKQSQGGGRERVRAAVGLIAATAALPWVVATFLYYFGVRLLDRGLRAAGRPPASPVTGQWFEAQGERLIFSFHRPLRLQDWGQRIVRAIEEGNVPRADIWHANDLETVPFALELRRRFGGYVVYDSHELFLEAGSRIRLNWLWRRILRLAERRWIRQVDAVVTVNEDVAAELAKRYGITRPAVVRNCPPRWTPAADFESPLRDAIASHGLDASRPIVIAHGGFQADRGFEQLMEAVLPLDTVNLVFMGYGARETVYRELAAAPPWRGRLVVLSAVPSEEVVSWVAGADIATCLIQPTTLNHRLSTPNKLFEATTAGVPILAANLQAIAAVVTGLRIGIVVDPRDVAAIRNGVSELLAMPAAEREALSNRARRAAIQELNWEHEFERLAHAYDNLAPSGSRA